MEYMIASGTTIGARTKEVNALIKKGWKPLGGVCAGDGWRLLLQAMIR